MPEYENELLHDIIKLSRKIQPMAEELDWSIADILAKMTEEIGEFAEAVQVERGKLPHKNKELEAPFYEAADAIICIVNVLARLYPKKSPAQVYTLLHHGIKKKSNIWEQRMNFLAKSDEDNKK